MTRADREALAAGRDRVERAAPMMLEALEGIEEAACSYMALGGSRRDQMIAAINTARAAIAAAKGEANA